MRYAKIEISKDIFDKFSSMDIVFVSNVIHSSFMCSFEPNAEPFASTMDLAVYVNLIIDDGNNRLTKWSQTLPGVNLAAQGIKVPIQCKDTDWPVQ